MPGDRLALAILVRREQQLVGFFSFAFSSETTFFLPRVDDVERSKSWSTSTPSRAHASFLNSPGSPRALREIADVADRRLDDVVLAEYPAIVFAFAGDSTITSFFPVEAAI